MTTENPLQNKTFKSIDRFFEFIFKIGEVIFQYITILFEVIGQIGNIGITAFFKYIVGFIIGIIKSIEKILIRIFSIFKPLNKIFEWFFTFVYKIVYKAYDMFFEVIKPIIMQFDNTSQYIIGFFIFLACSVYFFVYNKNEDITEGKKTDAINTLQTINIFQYLQFSAFFGKIYSVIKYVFKFFAIIVYSIIIGLFSSINIYEIFKKSNIDLNNYLQKNLAPESNFKMIIFILLYFPFFIFRVLYTFISSSWEIFYNKLSNFFSKPILEEEGNIFTKIIKPVIEFINKIYNNIQNHLNIIWEMPQISFLYVIISCVVYMVFLYQLYFWGSDDITKISGNNHLYYFFIISYFFFIAPLVYTLLKIPNQAFMGLIILTLSSISLLLMYVANYYINYHKSVGVDETPEQQSDRNTYNTLFVIYSAIIVFFVNFKILRPNFDKSTILFYILLNLFFIVALIGYSVSYKIKLTNRINKAATNTETPPPNVINSILKPEMTTFETARV